jgi:uncharacterized membrane protein YphA (DoxX/SURF4 family)
MQKFLSAAQLGAGRFEKREFDHPEVRGPFVGATEIIGGFGVLLGVGLRLDVLPLLVVIPVAILTTKWPMLRGQCFGATVHDSRADDCMLMGLRLPFVEGAGGWSFNCRRSSGHGASPQRERRLPERVFPALLKPLTV